MSDKTVGESMTLVINSADDESVFGDVNGGELNEPVRLAGEAVDDADDADDFRRREWDPPLSKKLKAS